MSSSRICTNCQAVVPKGHHFCGRCGAQYYEDGQAPADETLYFGAMMVPGRAKLILIKGEGLEGLSYHLNATEHLAGSASGVVLFPDDAYLSKRHATFLYRDNILYLRDEGSQNRTFLRVRKPRKLQDGDLIRVGEQLLRVELLDLKSEYPMHEETLMYVSPAKNYQFRLMHILDGGKPGAAYCSVNNDLLIGRQGCDVNFNGDRHVSPKHARVYWQDGAPVLEDLASMNGTYVNTHGEERLAHGDYVQVGSELLRVEINE